MAKQSGGIGGNHSYGSGRVLDVGLGSSAVLFPSCLGVETNKTPFMCGKTHFQLASPPLLPRGGLAGELTDGYLTQLQSSFGC